MVIEWLSFVLVGVAALAIGGGLGSTAHLRVVRNLVIAGACLRIVGVFARHAMIFDLYGGGSDAVAYFDAGRIIATYFWSLDFSIVGSGMWGDREWGTQAVRYASGLVIALVGPSMRGAFLAFSLAAYVGLVCVAVAFARTNGPASIRRCALFLFFWPTLWFWPSSIGKEAVLMLAVGLVVLGYVGLRDRTRWMPLASGLGLALAVRPHLAGVLAVSICIAEWAARGWTIRRILQAAVASVLALWLLTVALGMLGLTGAGFSGMNDFLLDTATQTNQGGSSFERADSLPVAIPMAFVNILFRPFITEARSPMALASSLEMMALWAIAIYNRRQVQQTLRLWRTSRLLRFAIPFALLYVLMIGLAFQNLGIIARQRALVMPALLILVAAAPAARTQHAAARPPRRAWSVQTRVPSTFSAGRVP
jgi:hypothetical protein